MYNIVLIAPSEACVEEVLRQNRVHICVLVANGVVNEKYCENTSIDETVSIADIMHYERMDGIDYELIEQLKETQFYFENAFNRLSTDYQMTKYYYYCGVSYWNNVFKKYKIDAIIKEDQNFGLIQDGIPFGIARLNKIPVYFIEGAEATGQKLILRREGGMKFEFLEGDAIDLHLDDAKFYSVNRDEVPVASSRWQNAGKLTRAMAKIVYRVGGVLAVELLDNLRRGSFVKEYGGNGIDSNYWDKVRSYRKMKKAQKYLKSLEHPFVDNGTNYIFYALHFEPEANIIARTVFESQLAIIQMLSDCIPEGWKVYVKEHPHQFNVNNWELGYMINNIDIFKTKAYYQKLASIKNVVIIDRKTTSKILIEKSCAVATMMGTVSLEASDFHKPVMLFAGYANLYGLVDDFYDIRSYEECKLAIQTIEAQGVRTYGVIENILSKYIIPNNRYDLMFSRICEDMGRRLQISDT